MSETAWLENYTGVFVLKAEWCCTCGTPFGLEANTERRLRESHETFYCPRGHRQHYTGETEETKLRKRLEREERYAANLNESLRIERAEVDAQRRSAAAYKGHLTRMRKRVANGVCPCCTRSFQNVKRHMATQHPEVLAQLEAAAQ